MKKSLLAVAVAAALPAAAFAQANVTLSGNVKLGVANTRISDGGVTGSGTSIDDGSSRFIISGSDDLGGGMKGIFMIDSRFRPDESGGALASGNAFVGVAGGFGSVRLGRLDTYYNLGTDEFGGRAVALQHSNISILSWVGGLAGGPAIANASRSANVIRYDMPAMGGLSGGVTYSFNFQGNDGAIDDPAKGEAWSLDLAWKSGPIAVGGAYWDADYEGLPTNDGQQAWRLYGSYDFGMFKVGLTWDDSKQKGATDFKRGAWSLPVTAKLGPGTVLFTYTQARDVKAASTISDTGAKMFAVGYDYPLSKRTSLGVSYAQLKNDANANYALFTMGALGGHPAPTAGQDMGQWYIGLRHAF
ncbi:MAG: porin [Burkholderiales bacterium]|nr:porin [Burkholderiales bacterium]